MIEEYHQAFEARVIIYKTWNQALSTFLSDKDHLKYEEAIALATLSLRSIREAIKDTDFPENYKSTISSIEALEDQHLRLSVFYHQNQIQNSPIPFTSITEIESEIMELIQELTPNSE